MSYEIGYSGKVPYLKIRYSQFWRKVKAALRAGLIDRFFELSPEIQAIVVAAAEQQDLIDLKVAEVSAMPWLD